MNGKLDVHQPIITIDSDVLDSLLLRARVGETITLTCSHCPPLLRNRREEKNCTGFWLFYFSGREGVPVKKLARHPGTRGRLADSRLNVIPQDISVFFRRLKTCPWLIGRLFIYTGAQSWYLDRSSHKFNIVTTAIPSISHTVKLPHGILEVTGAYIGNHYH